MTNASGRVDPEPQVDPIRLVAELWRRLPPVADEPFGDADGRVATLRRTLDTLASRAARLVVTGPVADRAAARLLADTARALHDALAASLAAAGWVDRLRFARMERWLAARAEADPDAEPAASLCLWVIEHLELAVALPRRSPPA